MMNRPLVLVCAVSLLALGSLSCSAGLVMPKRGIDEQFFRKSEGQMIPLAEYDFARLDQGYAITVFSYDYKGDKGNRITGFRDQHEKGMRVWEYRFQPNEWEVKWLEKKMMVWGYRTAVTLFLTKAGYDITLRLPFHRSRIVYAGRVVVDWDTYLSSGPAVEFHFDEDMGPWLEQFGDRIEDIKIDTSMMFPSF